MTLLPARRSAPRGLASAAFFLEETPMSPRVRKLVGSAGVLAFLGVYVWAAASIADHLPDGTAAQLAYFAVVGTLWGVPLFPLITWIQSGRWTR
jgi:hypothetical protein